MKYTFVFLLVLLNFSLRAEIAVLSVKNTLAAGCTGYVVIRAQGNAGPIQFTVVETGATFQNVKAMCRSLNCVRAIIRW